MESQPSKSNPLERISTGVLALLLTLAAALLYGCGMAYSQGIIADYSDSPLFDPSTQKVLYSGFMAATSTMLFTWQGWCAVGLLSVSHWYRKNLSLHWAAYSWIFFNMLMYHGCYNYGRGKAINSVLAATNHYLEAKVSGQNSDTLVVFEAGGKIYKFYGVKVSNGIGFAAYCTRNAQLIQIPVESIVLTKRELFDDIGDDMPSNIRRISSDTVGSED